MNNNEIMEEFEMEAVELHEQIEEENASRKEKRKRREVFPTGIRNKTSQRYNTAIRCGKIPHNPKMYHLFKK